jgi:hypothetical protein
MSFQFWDYTDSIYKGWRAFSGPYLGFQLSTKKLQFQKYLLGVKNTNFSGWVEASSEPAKKKQEQTTDAPAKDNKVAFRFDAVADSKTKFGGDLIVNCDNLKQVAVKAYAEHKLDDATTLKAKFEDHSKLTVGITRKFGNLLNFGFVSAVRLYLII